ncbi:PspC domain-containing protein [Leucobacter sp. wl10]|uniref:PspC domain-containing protein n=1 Tax=Leucobacter sp. wl10 TaxID=2304677 RepID=UPI000E5B8FAE|nr:PspC domain-containing protein [Leucobacter sp. wl10]RGE19481.1 PspC domain-containing protein [Leucobacter sp. wl10]
MDTSPDSERPGARPGGPPPGSAFFAWLRDLGIVRGSDRWFGGVAGGIAAKAGIDPLIVRGVFVVLALLGGPGLLIYLTGWLLLPDSRGRIHVEDVFRGRAETWVLITAIVIAAAVLLPAVLGILIPAATGFPVFSVWSWDVWGAIGVPGWVTATIAWLFWIAIIAVAGIWLRRVILDRGREKSGRAGEAPSGGADEPTVGGPSSGAAGSPAADGPGPSATDDDSAQRFSQRANDWGQRVGERANRWGEEVGRQADEWSVRYAEHHEAHRLGAAQTILTLALALLAGGLTGFWVLGFEAEPAIASVASAPLVAGLVAALAVLALSLIVAGVRGRHTGWVGFLAACGVFALLIAVVLPWGTRFQPFGNMRVDGLSSPGAVIIGGNADVDLRSLDANPGERGDLVVWQLAGNTTVTLPESRPTAVRARVLAGNISERGTERDGVRLSGPFLRNDTGVGLDRVDDAFADDSVVHVTVYLLAGNVRVEGARSNGPDESLAEKQRRKLEQEMAR